MKLTNRNFEATPQWLLDNANIIKATYFTGRKAYYCFMKLSDKRWVKEFNGLGTPWEIISKEKILDWLEHIDEEQSDNIYAQVTIDYKYNPYLNGNKFVIFNEDTLMGYAIRETNDNWRVGWCQYFEEDYGAEEENVSTDKLDSHIGWAFGEGTVMRSAELLLERLNDALNKEKEVN